ncbi:M20/M25/M40 family metallo-hydrolase [Polyangium jinanense]|uniref:Carboxypeptidase Q n=1 Tax=Polyangium jinanense TaxID=2829994 RepID=A0A9X4AWD5_9BACT|nr:M20/M25/M40 family metallo-hydrolase [Polyangium jinanense]MDC3956771.1 M20/M25/M40 family metallo-hydrolase [Polyangium jinanense]MDC3987233.1 M20/M25/M40 family metallo-hydrolase [Polyangium jinanense]
MYARSALLLATLSLAACSAAETPAPERIPAPAAATATASAAAAAPATASAAAPAPAPVPRDPNVDKLQLAAQVDSHAYDMVRSLVDEVGPRLAGSLGDKAAVAWALRTMKEKGLENVRAEKVMVPHWERGAESGRIVAPYAHTLAIAALGGSIGTPAKGLEGEIVMVESLDAMAAMDEAKVKGKIVFYSAPTTRTKDGSGYGKVAGIRYRGAIAAARKGAIGVLLRSIGTDHDRLPHTGGMVYDKDVPKIPAAAVSVPDAELIARLVGQGKPVRVSFSLGAKLLPDAESANVIGEVKGREKPDEIVLLGAHLDAWDLGQGAIDDGAGCAAVVEAARLVLGLGARPRRTIRVVLFANEENGLRGAVAYAKDHAAELDKHQLALEIDLGAGRVHMTRFLVAEGARPVTERIASLLSPLGIQYDKGPAHGGADLIPLHAAAVPIVDLHQDATKYFDVHHTANDTLDKVTKEDLDQVVGAVATVAWAAADAEETFARVPEELRKR